LSRRRFVRRRFVCASPPLWPSVLYSPLSSLQPSVHSTTLRSIWGSVPSTVLSSLYGPPSPLQSSAPSTALYPLCGHLFSQQPSVSSTALYLFYCHLSLLCYLSFLPCLSLLHPYVPSTALCPPLRYSVLSMALCSLSDSTTLCPLYDLCPLYGLCPLDGPLSTLRPYLFSTVLCPLYCALSPLWPSAPSTTLWLLHTPLSSLQPPSVLSSSLCHLYGPLFPL
jgi:hypothetical protein